MIPLSGGLCPMPISLYFAGGLCRSGTLACAVFANSTHLDAFDNPEIRTGPPGRMPVGLTPSRTQSLAEGSCGAAAFLACSDCSGETSKDCSTSARIPRAAAFAADSVVMQGIL